MKNLKRKTLTEYAIPAVIAFLVFVIFLAMCGTFPFGSDLIVGVDYNGLWNIMHFNVRPFFSVAFSEGTALLNPIFWLIGIFPREYVSQSMTLVVAFMVAFTAWLAYFSFKKLFPNVGKYYIMFFSVIWAVSPFMLMNYQVLEWLNILALLPLLILSIKHMHDKNKILPFVLVMTACLVLCFNISVTLMCAAILIAAVFIAFNFKEQKKFVCNILIGLLFAFGLSSVFVLPTLIHWLQSYSFTDVITPNYGHFFGKLIVLGWWALPIALSVKYFIRHWKDDKKTVRFFLVSLLILLSGVIFERMNVAWNGGDYEGSSYRVGFIILFAFIYISLYYMNNFKASNEVQPIKRRGWVIFALVVSALAYVAGVAYYIHPISTLQWVVGLVVVGIAMTGFFVYDLSIKFNRAVTRNILVVCFSAISIFTLAFSHFGIPYSAESDHAKLAYSIITDNFELPYRIKDKNNYLPYNYPSILNYPSLAAEENAYRYLGYNTDGRDSGGTLFSDMMLGVKYVISNEGLASYNDVYSVAKNRYEYGNNGEIISQFELQNTLPFIQLLDKDINIGKINATDIVDAQNEIYNKFFGKSGQILSKLPLTRTPVAENTVMHLKLSNTNLTVETALYLYVDDVTDGYMFRRADWLGNEEAFLKDRNAFIKQFGVPLKNGLNDMGIWYNVTQDYYIYAPNANSANTFVAGIRTSDLGIVAQEAIANTPNLAAEIDDTFEYTAAGVKFKITAGVDRQAFIPFVYREGMTAKINGKVVPVSRALNAFISLDLVEGENEIELVFMPVGYYWGLGLSLGFVVLFIAFILLNNKFKFTDNKVVQIVFLSLGGIAVLVVSFFVIAKPFVLTFMDIF